MIPDIPVDTTIELPKWGTWPKSVHLFDQPSADAILAALAAERPLLVRGEPGAGKSQLARAAAQHLGRLFVSTVVHARCEAQDLQWEYDAVARLGEAQVLATVPSSLSHAERLDPRRYLIPGPLWWVFGWVHAMRHIEKYEITKASPPLAPPGWGPERGTVLLIDEIDKAEPDVPNDLLEALDRGRFEVTDLNPVLEVQGRRERVLMVITSNRERELPNAFLRRCVALHLPEPDADWLVTVAAERLGRRGAKLHAPVAERVLAVRDRLKDEPGRKPGTAEYLDALEACIRLGIGPDADAWALVESATLWKRAPAAA
jgi:MoxR-like ATPase